MKTSSILILIKARKIAECYVGLEENTNELTYNPKGFVRKLNSESLLTAVQGEALRTRVTDTRIYSTTR